MLNKPITINEDVSEETRTLLKLAKAFGDAMIVMIAIDRWHLPFIGNVRDQGRRGEGSAKRLSLGEIREIGARLGPRAWRRARDFDPLQAACTPKYYLTCQSRGNICDIATSLTWPRSIMIRDHHRACFTTSD